ncbi:MAG: BrnA antitoxin family protein [Devosia sp.]
MTAKKPTTESSWIDPDDAPELTREWFEQADLYDGEKLIRRGRRPSDNPKKAISLRIDADVLDKFKADGPGWQGRMNDVLRKAAGL